MKCPHCGNEINIGSLMGSVISKAKARAARRNAKLGGWPKGKKRGKRKPKDANITAFSVVQQAEKLTQQAQPPQLPKAE